MPYCSCRVSVDQLPTAKMRFTAHQLAILMLVFRHSLAINAFHIDQALRRPRMGARSEALEIQNTTVFDPPRKRVPTPVS